MNSKKHLTYLATKTDGIYSLNTSFGDYDSSDLHDLEYIERILRNIASVYIGMIEPNDGMPASEAREDDTPMITGVEYEKGKLVILFYYEDVVEIATTVAISEISPNQEITAQTLGDWCLDHLKERSIKTSESIQGQLSQDIIGEDIDNSLEAIQALYSKSDLEFIKGAKDSSLEAHLIDCDFYNGGCDYLIDGIIKGLDSSINLDGIEKYQSLPCGIVPTGESYKLEVNHRKINLIKLLSLKYAINEEINEELETMRIITKKRGHYAN